MVSAKLQVDISSSWLLFKLVVAYQCVAPERDSISDIQSSLSLARKSWVVIALVVISLVFLELLCLVFFF